MFMPISLFLATAARWVIPLQGLGVKRVNDTFDSKDHLVVDSFTGGRRRCTRIEPQISGIYEVNGNVFTKVHENVDLRFNTTPPLPLDIVLVHHETGHELLNIKQSKNDGHLATVIDDRVDNVLIPSSGNSVSLTFRNVSLDDAGEYHLRNKNEPITLMGSLGLVVLSKPSITFIQPVYTFPPIENEAYAIRCPGSSTSRPSGFGVSLSYVWTERGSVIDKANDRYTMNNDWLVINLVRKEDSELEFGCQIMENGGGLSVASDLSTIYRFQPHYAPIVTLEPSGRYNIEKGQSANFLCTSDAYPPVSASSYIWTDGSGRISQLTEVSNGFLYEFHAADETSEGTYQCKATNSVGTGSASVFIDMQSGVTNHSTSSVVSTLVSVEETGIGSSVSSPTGLPNTSGPTGTNSTESPSTQSPRPTSRSTNGFTNHSNSSVVSTPVSVGLTNDQASIISVVVIVVASGTGFCIFVAVVVIAIKGRRKPKGSSQRIGMERNQNYHLQLHNIDEASLSGEYDTDITSCQTFKPRPRPNRPLNDGHISSDDLKESTLQDISSCSTDGSEDNDIPPKSDKDVNELDAQYIVVNEVNDRKKNESRICPVEILYQTVEVDVCSTEAICGDRPGTTEAECGVPIYATVNKARKDKQITDETNHPDSKNGELYDVSESDGHSCGEKNPDQIQIPEGRINTDTDSPNVHTNDGPNKPPRVQPLFKHEEENVILKSITQNMS